MFTSASSAEKIIEKSCKFLEKGKHEKAVQVFEAPLSKDPQNCDLLMGLADTYCKIQEVPSALREFRKAFKSDPAKGREVLRRIEEPSGGLSRSEFFELRVEILIYLRDFEAALQVIGETESTSVTRVLDRTKKRLQELEKLSGDRQNAKLMAELGFLVGLILEHRKAYDEAFSIYEAIVKSREEELLRVLPHLEEVVQYVEKDAQPFLCMGNLVFASDPEKSAYYFDRALDLDAASSVTVFEKLEGVPETPGSCWLLGKAHLLSGDWGKGTDLLQGLQEPEYRKRILSLLKKINPPLSEAAPLILFWGDLLFEENKYEEATKTYAALSGRVDAGVLRERLKKIVENAPDDVGAARLLGELCLEEGDLDDSIVQMRKIVQSDPTQAPRLFDKAFPFLQDHFDDPELCLFLAELCLGHSDAERPLVLIRHFLQLSPTASERVFPFLQELVKRHPDDPMVHIGAAEGWMVQGRNLEALQALRKAVHLEPGVVTDVLHSLSKIARGTPSLCAEMEHLYSDWEQRGIKEPAMTLVRAEASMAAGRIQEGMEQVIHCVRQVPEQMSVIQELVAEWEATHPDRLEIPLGRAELLFRLKRFEELSEGLAATLRRRPDAAGKIISFYRSKIQVAPKEFLLYRGILATYLQGGMFDLVLAEGKKLGSLFRTFQISIIHRMMGDAAVETGNFADAVAFYFQTYKEDPSSAEDIVERLQHILALSPSFPKASLALGIVLAHCDRVGEGVSCLMRLARDLPKSRETVMRYLQKIATEHPAVVEPMLAMAELYVYSGAHEKALEFIWKALQREEGHFETILGLLTDISEKHPDIARVQLEVGKVYLKTGHYRQAADHIQRSVEMDPALSGEGIKFSHDIIARAPDEIAAYDVISRIFLQMNRPAAAVAFLSSSGEGRPEIREALLERVEAIKEKFPKNPEILKLLAWDYFRTERTRDAVTTMTEAVHLDSSLAQEGEKFFTAVIQQAPRDAQAKRARGECRLHTLNLAGAFEDICSAGCVDPTQGAEDLSLLAALYEKGFRSMDLFRLLPNLYAEQGKCERSIQLLREALGTTSKKEERVELLIRFSEIYERQGERKTALRHLQEAGNLSENQDFYYRKLNEFSVQKIVRETKVLEQKASQGGLLPRKDLERLVSYLILQGRENEAQNFMRRQVTGREGGEVREIWGHFFEEAGHYYLAAQFSGANDLYHQAYLQMRAGNELLAASLLEEAVGENPASERVAFLRAAYEILMEESLLQEKRPLMGEVPFRIFGNHPVKEESPLAGR